LYLSVVGWPMDGADDAVKMGTRGLLSEHYYPNLRTRSRHHQSPNADWQLFSYFKRAINTPLTWGRYHIPHQSTVALQAPQCVQQDRSTVSAYIVNCVRAGDENGRCMYYIFDAPGFYYSQCSLWIFHDRLSSIVRTHMRIYGKGPAPAKAERGDFRGSVLVLCDAYLARFHT
jgi:hypothetical protein